MNKRGVQVVSAGMMLMLAGLAAVPGVASVDPTPALPVSEAPTDVDAAIADPFPVPESLRENVAFWRSVFSEWRQNQVALHDMDYPGIVYQVIDLDGEVVNDSLNDTQREQVAEARLELEARLQRLATADLIELDAEELALHQRIARAAGADAVAGAYLRVRAQRGVRERFKRGLAISGRYDATFRRIFKDAGLPEDLAYLPHVESSFQNHARSSVGATGMWQFTRGAGRMFMNVNHAVDERRDPIASARGAARYLGEAHNRLGHWAFAVTSYNHGMQGMARAKTQFGDDFGRVVREYQSKTFGFASRNFYAEFLAAREIASQPERFFPEGVSFERPSNRDSVFLERAALARYIAARYGVKTADLVALNPAWSSKATRNKTPIPAGVQVWLPSGTLLASSKRNKEMLTLATREETTGPARGGIMRASLTQVTDVHVVRRGDTLTQIAKRYKLDMASLRELNDMAPNQHTVRIGQKIKLRSETENVADVVVHVVRKGDTASVIAANYGVSVRHLLTSNQLTKRSVIRPGQRLGIPVSR